MGPNAFQCLLHLLFLSTPFICSGTTMKGQGSGVYNQTEQTWQVIQRQLMGRDLKPKSRVIQKDELPPGSAVPVINPSPTFTPVINPSTGLPPFTPVITAPPSTTTSSLSGKVWCIASSTASPTALQVALDYACGYGGADCSAIQSGGSCFNPDTVRDHASYAFNSYYQKNPIATSCNFGGTAEITTTDPSTPNCQYPASSATSNQLPPMTGNPTTPTTTTPTIFGIPPPAFGDNSGFSGSTYLSRLTLVHLLLLLAAAVAN